MTETEKHKALARNLAILALGSMIYTSMSVGPPRAASFERKSLPFESDPAGARVCERRKGSIVCFDRTPCDVSAEFASGNNSREYILRKIGYEPAKVIVTRTDNKIRVPLKKRVLFDEPNTESGEEFRNVRGMVTRALRRRIHEDPAFFDDSGFDILGRIGILKQSDGYFVGLGILLDDKFRQTELRAIERIRNRNQREDALVRGVLGYAGGRALVEMGNALRDVGKVKGIILNVYYRKFRSVLEDDIGSFTVQKTWTWVQGGYEYKKHFWYTQQVTGTTVGDVEDLYTVAVRADMKDIPNTEAQCCTSVLASGEIFINDNRNRKMERYSR